MFETFSEKVIKLSREIPEKEAVIFRKETLSYGELARRAQNVARYLVSKGVKKGDRVLFSAISRPESIVAYLGIQYAGAITVFIDKNSLPKNALDIYEEAEAVLFLTDMKLPGISGNVRVESMKAVCTGSGIAGGAANQDNSGASSQDDSGTVCRDGGACPADSASFHPSCGPEDISEILFTTGTTGKPKGVMLSHRAVLSILKHTKEGIGITENDRVLIPLPMHHSFSLREMRATLSSGGTVVLQNGFTFAREIEQNLDQHGCTAMIGVPVSMELVRAQMKERFYEIMGRFRYIEIGAGSLTLEQRKRLAEKLPNTVIQNTWGSSETGGAIFANISEAVKNPLHVTSIGKPLPDIKVEVLDEAGNPMESDEEHTGRLALYGEMVMSGYWKAEALTDDALRDGWLLTNDIVYADADGYIHMLGRADDLINVGGEKVSPIDVENIASECPGIRECGCIGVPDTLTGLGEVPVLYFVSDELKDEDEIRSFILANAEKYKLPSYYIQVDALPRNRMEKLDRKALKRMWAERTEE